MQGILLVDKPKDWTSFDVVNYVRKIVAAHEGKKPKNVKVGHTGTLDPKATGLLVLLVGKEYTRQAQRLTKLDKTYEVTMKLGETSTTGDEEGVKSQVESRKFESGEVATVLQHFVGDSMQVPPAFSAMKIDGKRAYKLAREGKEVKLDARPIHIESIELTSYTYPYIQFTANVGSGTYIRSLVEDIGASLGTGAYMTDLRRTTVGEFKIANAIGVKAFKTEDLSEKGDYTPMPSR
jgi:tRNA pseudouridine55 synthase